VGCSIEGSKGKPKRSMNGDGNENKLLPHSSIEGFQFNQFTIKTWLVTLRNNVIYVFGTYLLFWKTGH
jgi:hypothetical protein